MVASWTSAIIKGHLIGVWKPRSRVTIFWPYVRMRVALAAERRRLATSSFPLKNRRGRRERADPESTRRLIFRSLSCKIRRRSLAAAGVRLSEGSCSAAAHPSLN